VGCAILHAGRVAGALPLWYGYRVNLPDPIHVKTGFATFDKAYKYENGEIVAERDIVVLKNKIPGADWKSYQTFTKNIGLGSEAWIQLIPPEKSMKVHVFGEDQPPNHQTERQSEPQQ
jgi:hypothetical protein